jgi:hypothetical protein
MPTTLDSKTSLQQPLRFARLKVGRPAASRSADRYVHRLTGWWLSSLRVGGSRRARAISARSAALNPTRYLTGQSSCRRSSGTIVTAITDGAAGWVHYHQNVLAHGEDIMNTDAHK